MTHTPGPWEWIRDKKDDSEGEDGFLANHSLYESWHQRGAPRGEYPIVLIAVWHNDSTAGVSVENPSDARLIAAAPELLAACQAVADARFDFSSVELIQVEKAIEKAEGR